MIDPANDLLRQPLHSVADLSAADIPAEPGVYAWYRRGQLFYVGRARVSAGSASCGRAPARPSSSTTKRQPVVASSATRSREESSPASQRRSPSRVAGYPHTIDIRASSSSRSTRQA